MNSYLKLTTVLLLGVILFAMVSPSQPTQAQTGDPEQDLTTQLYVEINRYFIEAEELPLGRSEVLDAVAQVIADELGETGTYRSVPPVLADEEGYPRWSDNSQRILSAPYQFIGIQNPFEVATIWQEAIIESANTGNFREMGIATSSYVAVRGGTVQNVYVVVMGAQPNVIPAVINAGEPKVYDRNVELYIRNELSLAYFTDDNTIQQADTVRIANSEDELASAPELKWEEVSFAYPWELTDGFGEKSVWVEWTDDKGFSITYEAIVEYADANAIPEPIPSVAEIPITLVLSYEGNTFTLQIETERDDVRIQEIYFTWLDGLRAYEIENADNLIDVDLEEFSPNDCIQIRTRSEQIEPVDGCDNIFLDANEFINVSQVFWNPEEFDTFVVYDGPRELGICETSAGVCEIQLRP